MIMYNRNTICGRFARLYEDSSQSPLLRHQPVYPGPADYLTLIRIIWDCTGILEFCNELMYHQKAPRGEKKFRSRGVPYLRRWHNNSMYTSGYSTGIYYNDTYTCRLLN